MNWKSKKCPVERVRAGGEMDSALKFSVSGGRVCYINKLHSSNDVINIWLLINWQMVRIQVDLSLMRCIFSSAIEDNGRDGMMWNSSQAQWTLGYLDQKNWHKCKVSIILSHPLNGVLEDWLIRSSSLVKRLIFCFN